MKRRPEVAIIGAGTVGTGIALALRRCGFRISTVISRRKASAARLASRVRARHWDVDPAIIPPEVSIIAIAVPDTEIAAAVRSLADALPPTRRRRYVFHTSGAATSDLLRPLRRRGLTACSIHPMHAFPDVRLPRASSDDLRGEWFGIEGPPTAVRWASSLVRSVGGRPLVVPKAKKTLYHIACTFAANYPLALLQAAELTARRAGLKGGRDPMATLMEGAVRNGRAFGPMRALTGPVVRGDDRTVRRHRSELRKHLPELIGLFEALVGTTARQAERAGRISAARARSVRKRVTP